LEKQPLGSVDPGTWIILPSGRRALVLTPRDENTGEMDVLIDGETEETTFKPGLWVEVDRMFAEMAPVAGIH
jgi:hypothetical protein